MKMWDGGGVSGKWGLEWKAIRMTEGGLRCSCMKSRQITGHSEEGIVN